MNNPILALATEYLAVLGLGALFGATKAWLARRFKLDLNLRRIPPGSRSFGPLSLEWLSFGIPRRFRVTRRWDRPGALVNLPDGRYGHVLAVYTDPDTDGAMVTVRPEDTFPGDDVTPLWVTRESLTPVPSGVAVAAQDGGLA